MKRVLIVINSLWNGGAERSLVNLLNEMDPKRYSVDLLMLLPEGIFISQIPNWVHILETPYVIRDLYGSKGKYKRNLYNKFIRYYGTLVSRIYCDHKNKSEAFRWKHFYKKRIKYIDGIYDLAVAYVSGDPMFLISDRVHAKKKVLWVHNDYRTARFPKKYDIEHYEKMEVIISISDKCVEILKEEFPKLADRIHMIPNITSSRVVKNRANENFPPEFIGKSNIIVSVGRLWCEQKGFDIAVDAANELKKRNIEFTWFVLGDGRDYDKLITQIKRHRLEKEFILLGIRVNPYVYIKHCTILAQTSRFEGKSVVLDEAKILAIPILSTNYPTVYDQIIDGKEGMIVDMTPVGIADGLEKMLTDTEYRNKINSYLSQHEYGNQELVDKYYTLFDNLMYSYER